mmetsp:Transcript_24562/g.40715  ORF Transcript_24562/g.40715 Transcript_24562/m.40715 type:complete len:251 (-) Transcript_24562:565-1317(-)
MHPAEQCRVERVVFQGEAVASQKLPISQLIVRFAQLFSSPKRTLRNEQRIGAVIPLGEQDLHIGTQLHSASLVHCLVRNPLNVHSLLALLSHISLFILLSLLAIRAFFILHSLLAITAFFIPFNILALLKLLTILMIYAVLAVVTVVKKRTLVVQEVCERHQRLAILGIYEIGTTRGERRCIQVGFKRWQQRRFSHPRFRRRAEVLHQPSFALVTHLIETCASQHAQLFSRPEMRQGLCPWKASQVGKPA